MYPDSMKLNISFPVDTFRMPEDFVDDIGKQ